jgi:preprotein translocase subunit SecA
MRLKIEDLPEMIKERALTEFREREKLFGKEDMERLERYLILQIIDDKWVAHLQAMDHMKEGIGLRGYGQLDP